MDRTKDMQPCRITIFTGKGGVGKTSVIAAHALRSAEEGKRTLLVSADMAHNLGDLFETDTHGEITQAEEGLDLLELDPGRILREEFTEVNRALLSIVSDRKGAIDAGGRFMLPGFENLFSLLKIQKLYRSAVYERIFVDCAPSGETLSLLRLPELLSWYIEKFGPVGRMMVRGLRPVSGKLYRVSLPDEKGIDALGQLHRDLMELEELLRDEEVTDVRMVCLPEKMVVEETRRTYMYLNLYGYHVDLVFINRVLGDVGENPFLLQWKEIQRGYIEELEQVFAGVPLLYLPWYEDEIRGIAALRRMAADLPEPAVLFERAPSGEREIYEAAEEGYYLHLPVKDAENVQVTEGTGELVLRLGQSVRRIPLPGTLRGWEIAEVRREGDHIAVLFREKGR